MAAVNKKERAANARAYDAWAAKKDAEERRERIEKNLDAVLSQITVGDQPSSEVPCAYCGGTVSASRCQQCGAPKGG